MKTDLTKFSDSELSLQVFKTENLYNLLNEEGKYVLLGELKDLFLYTEAQLRVLKVDIEDHLAEQREPDEDEEDDKALDSWRDDQCE